MLGACVEAVMWWGSGGWCSEVRAGAREAVVFAVLSVVLGCDGMDGRVDCSAGSEACSALNVSPA